MRLPKNLWLSFVVGAIVIALDQLTKYLAVTHITGSYVVNRFLSFELVFNRGVSWGLFHSAHTWPFVAITVLSGFFLVGVCLFAWHQRRAGYTIVGETLVIAGALSNMIDRYLYKGVVDFITLTYNEWSWPVFNIADCCIVLGTILIIVKLNKQ